MQQVPRIRVLQNAALLRSEGALLVWGSSLDQVRDQLTQLEAQVAEAVISAEGSRPDAHTTITAAPRRTMNTSTPIATYLAFVGCAVIVTLEVGVLHTLCHHRCMVLTACSRRQLHVHRKQPCWFCVVRNGRTAGHDLIVVTINVATVH